MEWDLEKGKKILFPLMPLDGGLQREYILFLFEDKGKCIPVSWYSKCSRRVCRNILAC